MRRVGWVALGLVFAVLATAPTAHAEKRIALLIGNKDYKPGVGALVNPLNDIRIVGEALTAVGFEVLQPARNARRAEMLLAIHAFAAKLSAAGGDAVGFLYYSGHGIASAGENFLIPVDVEEPSSEQLSVHAVRHSEVLAILRNKAPHAAHYLVLDACRNTLGGARGGKGFVPVGQQSGVLVAFAAEPGKTASDTDSGSGPYAAALATELVRPGQSDLIMFHNVRVAVIEKTEGDRVPWTEDGIQRRERVLFGGDGPKPSPGPTQPTSAAEVVRVCREVEAMTSLSMLGVLERQHAGTPAADCISARIGELKAAQAVAAQAAEGKKRAEEVAARAKSEAERQRLAMLEQQRQDEARKAAETVAARNRSEAASATAPGTVFRDCPDCPEMVVVPAGQFTMGSLANEPQRDSDEAQVRVSIARPFAVGKFAVTFDEWDACVAGGGCNGYRPDDRRWGRGTRPVINVNWDDAKAYTAWLSKKTGKTYRLPSEAEREYVARAGTTTPFWWGTTISTAQANYDGSHTYGGGAKGEFRGRTMPVDSFKANPWGLYNVHGNVWEWTEDCWNDTNTGNPGDGRARTSGDCSRRVVRGGSWGYFPQFLRSANREGDTPDDRSDSFGFRLARTLNP